MIRMLLASRTVGENQKFLFRQSGGRWAFQHAVLSAPAPLNQAAGASAVLHLSSSVFFGMGQYDLEADAVALVPSSSGAPYYEF